MDSNCTLTPTSSNSYIDTVRQWIYFTELFYFDNSFNVSFFIQYVSNHFRLCLVSFNKNTYAFFS